MWMPGAARLLALTLPLTGLAGAALAAPEPSPVTPALVEAAKKEGKVVFYTSIDVQLAQKIAKAFETKYPGVSVQVERNGAERNFQRIMQERSANIFVADVIESSDTTHLITWKQKGWLEPYLPAEVAEKWPADQRDPDGAFATVRLTLSPIAYNTKYVKPDEAPKSFADLLDPKWDGRIVKAHPGYSGVIMTATFELSHALGWDYFRKLAKQHVLQVQSASEPPKKLAIGERPISADGVEYLLLELKEGGAPIEIVYPSEGTPTIPGSAGIAQNAPHPNAARLLTSYLFSREGQQLMSDVGAMRSVDPDVTPKPGRKPLSEIKLMKADPEAQVKETEEIKRKYTEIFGL